MKPNIKPNQLENLRDWLFRILSHTKTWRHVNGQSGRCGRGRSFSEKRNKVNIKTDNGLLTIEFTQCIDPPCSSIRVEFFQPLVYLECEVEWELDRRNRLKTIEGLTAATMEIIKREFVKEGDE